MLSVCCCCSDFLIFSCCCVCVSVRGGVDVGIVVFVGVRWCLLVFAVVCVLFLLTFSLCLAGGGGGLNSVKRNPAVQSKFNFHGISSLDLNVHVETPASDDKKQSSEDESDN